ncbi:kinase-like domain-containing protein [Rhizoctonia solani]|nr:kinase-like domain-containing protein [Rhizoctonia solani]
MASTSGLNQRPAAFNNEGGRFVNSSTYASSLESTSLTPWVPSVPEVPEPFHYADAHGRPLTSGDRPSFLPTSSAMRTAPHDGLGQKYPESTNVEASTQYDPAPNSWGDSPSSERIVVAVTHDRVSYVNIDITNQTGDAQAIRKEIASKMVNNPHLEFNISWIMQPESTTTVALGDDELLATCLGLGDDRGTLKLLVDLMPRAVPSSSVKVQVTSSAQESQFHPSSSATASARFSMPEPNVLHVGSGSLGGGSNSGHLGNSPARHVADQGRSRYSYRDPITNSDGNLTMPEPTHTQQQSEPDVSRFSVPYYEECPIVVANTPRTSISGLPSPSTPPPGRSYIARNTLHSEPPEMTETDILQRSTEHSPDATASIDHPQNPAIKSGQVLDGPRGTISRRMTTDEVLRELYLHGCRNITPYLNRAMSGDNPVAGGGFGDVYRGALNNGTAVGLKCVRLEVDLDNAGQKRVKEAAKELYIWSKCNHPNVLELIGVTQHHNRIAMVSPWMENGDLTRFLQTHPETDRYNLCAQIAEGVAYLHQEDVVHGDIKGANILVSNEHTPKITDFGTASKNDYTLQFTETSKSQTMSIRWTAPEIISEVADKSTFKTDVFSLGMTILEVITGVIPFHGMNEAVVVLKLVTGVHPPRPEAHIPTGNERADLLWALLVDCWALKPEDRPTSIEVRNRMRNIALM